MFQVYSRVIQFYRYMLLLLLSRFSRVRLCATPETAAHQAPPSLGFSRHEQWSGLPFPLPMQESEKWKWSCSVWSNSLQPHGLQPIRLLRPWDFPGKSTGVGCHGLLKYNPSGWEYKPWSLSRFESQLYHLAVWSLGFIIIIHLTDTDIVFYVPETVVIVWEILPY